ncbi:MAG: alanine racemase [Deltaproteobacteria bacterium]|nr:alanine racemase [Deltaproteobacteria bacterium]
MAARAAPSSIPVARIDSGALVANYREAQRLVGDRVTVLAMVKSDAYGHGALGCADALARAGCSVFGVATRVEAAELAPLLGRTSPRGRLLLFGGMVPGDAEAVVETGAEVVTQEIEVVEALAARATALGREVAVHVKIDTGMHRLGISPAAVVDFVRRIGALKGVRAAAICSHFAQAESVTGEVTAGQLESLLGADRALREAGLALPRHLANSAAIITRKEAHLDMVRPGIMLYGIHPDPGLRGRAALRPVMRLEACIVRVADIAAGEGVSYGHTYRTKAVTRIATVRCGYADGYPRHLSNLGTVLVEGREAPVVGRVCMDQTMIDVTGIEGVRVGGVATMWGGGICVEEMATRAGTIAYELVTRVGKRVQRIIE